MSTEEWRAIPGYEGIYEVSDQGSVRSLARKDSRGRARSAKIRKATVMPSGHRTIGLCRDGVPRTFQLHHLVLMAFVGPRPDGLEACHRNDNPADNRLANLRWDTRSANQLDSVRNGTHHVASRTHCPQGHEYTDDNTYRSPTNRRVCRECRRAYQEAHRDERREKGREYGRRRRASARQAATSRKAA